MSDCSEPVGHQDKAWAELDMYIRSKHLVELHTHLLGMGSADFWVHRIMETYLPRIYIREEWNAKGKESFKNHLKKLMQYQLEADKDSVCKSVEHLVDDLSNNSVVENSSLYLFTFDNQLWKELVKQDRNKLRWFLSTYTDDVVYGYEALFLLFNVQRKPTSSRDDADHSPRKRRRISSSESSTSLTRLNVQSKSTSSRDDVGHSFHNQQRTSSSELSTSLTFLANLMGTSTKLFIIFNARKRQFQLVRGITNSELVELMKPTNSNSKTIRAAVRNGFSMLSRDGEAPTSSDIYAYKHRFTPEFYPKRFKMKDCIYEQRLEVLSILLNQVINRYDKAGVRYVEFSLSVNDLLNADVCKHLVRKVFTEMSTPLRTPTKAKQPSRPANRAKDQAEHGSDPFLSYDAVRPAVLSGFPWRCRGIRNGGTNTVAMDAPTSGSDIEETRLDVNPRSSVRYNALITRPKWAKALGMCHAKPRGFLYGFIASFNRGGVHTGGGHYLNTPDDAMDFLKCDGGGKARELCSRASTPEESDAKVKQAFPAIFGDDGPVQGIRAKVLSESGSLRSFWNDYVVGLDWVGDEYGFPYCAFVHSAFVGSDGIVQNMRRYQKRFGIRVHCGESLPLLPLEQDSGSSDQIAFENHLSVVVDGLVRIHEGIKRNLRIGHGVAFLHGISEMAKKARDFIISKGIVCELNMTSNLHLVLSQNSTSEVAVRKFLDAKVPVVLSTDDDGIWIIRKCKPHYHHTSVAAEFCKAIETGGILRADEIKELVLRAQEATFY